MEKVTFILTTFNSCDNLKRTMESILIQDYPEVEVVIKDGGSQDGTIDVIRQYKSILGDRLVWKSQPDRGIYDAMNQGYELSTGDVIVFFNDVLLQSNVVSKMIDAISTGGKNCLGAHADLVYVDGEKIIRTWKMGPGRFRTGWMPGHPTLYVRRSVFEEVGLYDTSYKCSADYEFMLRAFYGREKCLAYVPETMVKMFYGGTSTSGLKSYWISLKEGHMALKKNHIKLALWIDFRRVLRVFMQFLK